MELEAGDPAVLRSRLADGLVAAGRVRTEPVERAFRAVPRHLFLPGTALELAYADEAVPTRWAADGRPVSSSSQPAIMALMLEQLAVAPGHRVLEIGAGTGYNAALLAHLAGPAGHVVTIDLDPEVADQARAHLVAAGLATSPAGTPTTPETDAITPGAAAAVTVVTGDGAAGWAGGGPYDRIIVTAGAWDLAPAWREQLAAGGRLVVPLSLRGMQRSVAFEPAGACWASVSIVDCGFMPLRGAMAEPGGPRQVGGQRGLFVSVDDDRPLDTDGLYAALTRPGGVVPVGVRAGRGDLWGGLALWLALREPDLVQLGALGPAVEVGLVPVLLAFGTQVMTLGLISPDGPVSLAALTTVDAGPDGPGTELAAGAFGPAGADLAHRLADQVRAWEAHGRPATDQLRLRAYPVGDRPAGATTVIEKRHTVLELGWSTG
jgi:protein-L-isoaspartate(D-aspartate) O-methyltransferase